MAEALVGVLLEKLISQIGNGSWVFRGFDRDMNKLRKMFTEIKPMLEDAEEKQFTNRSMKNWLQKLKGAVHELDDIIDEYAYEEMELEYEGYKSLVSDKVPCSCLSSLHPKHVAFRCKIAKKMEKIIERFDEIAEERKAFQLIETVAERRSEIPEWCPQTNSWIIEQQICGREEEQKKIVDFLVGDASHSKDIPVYTIHGKGGLGKTTLAKLVFNDKRVVNNFELRSWVCLSEEKFTWKRMLTEIVEVATKSSRTYENLEQDSLQRRLQDQIQNKRCLLVLDDVCDDQELEICRLKSLLCCGANGSSILVTTCTESVSVATKLGTMPPHSLSRLSNNDCWKLFKNQVFECNEEEQVNLVNMGKEIVDMCGGMPFAAKLLGGLLRSTREEKDWRDVLQSMSTPQNENFPIIPALRLSYMKLPIILKNCLAYCAIFPKDKIIRKQDLIDLWMANGSISSIGPLDVEDVGNGIWYELYCRSFFQDIEINNFGNVSSFKMHDLVHKLAQFVAEEVRCFTNDNGITINSLEGIQHMADHSRGSNSESIELDQVTSLKTYILVPHRYNIGLLSPSVLKCYSLRVLHYELRDKLSSSIGNLKHLRYLNLSEGDFITLPESLCKLWNLQILKLDYCHRLRKLPNNLVHLKALQKLSLNGCNSLSSLPPKIGKLTSLRNISMYIVGKKRGFLLEELGPLKLKGDLCIKHLGKVKNVTDATNANMSSKQLNKLWLSWDNHEEFNMQGNVEEILEELQPNVQQLQRLSVEGYRGVHFPQWMSSSSLTYLELDNCNRCSKLPALGKLHSLKDLVISKMARVEYLYEESYDGGVIFTALESLLLKELPDLKRLSTEDGENMFPHLSRLEISECPNLVGLPGFPSILRLHIQGKCKQDLLSSINKLGSLKCLWFEDIEELTCFSDGILQNLTSLKKLYFYRLFKLEQLPTKLLLPSLRKLEIVGCHNFKDPIGLHNALQNLNALHSLKLEHLPSLELLPDCFENLGLLHKLTLYNCSKLKCLSTSLRYSNLKRLDIYDCPELVKRCQEYTGEDWPIIAHIPNIRVIPMRR